jgi:hypothetical protein
VEEIVEENYSFLHEKKDKKETKHPFGKKSHNFVSAVPNVEQQRFAKNSSCKFCAKEHQSYYCDTYPKQSDRYQRARDLKICLNCLTKGNDSRACKSKSCCSHCQKKTFFWIVSK